MNTVRLRLLVGRIADEDTPVVAASVDESIYDVGGDDVWDSEKVKREWPSDYEWREVLVSMSAPLLLGHFNVPEIGAIVHSPEASK